MKRGAYADMAERLIANSVPMDGGCWIWTGARCRNGYGRINVWQRGENRTLMQQAHRVAFEHLKGEAVPASWDVHHTCGNRACINPEHLEAMYHRENCQTGRRNNNHAGSFKRKEQDNGI